jgi:hypothetical protein
MTRSLKLTRLKLIPALLLLVLLRPQPAVAGFDSVLNAWAEQVTDFFDELLEPLTGPIVQSASPPQQPTSNRQDRFWQYLADAGYEVSAIETDIGLIPNFKVTLQIVRELSEADRTAIERDLLIDDLRDPGLVPSLQRQIVHALLKASQSGEMRVSKLTIGFFPLPAADFTMTPAQGPFSAQNSLNNQQGGASKGAKSKPAGEPAEPHKPPAKTVGE